MVLPSTGKISFSQLQTEFGGTNAISFSEYYRDKANKYAYAVTASPLTGNVIRMSNFRGVSKAYPPATIEYNAGSQNYTSEHNGSNTFEINIYTNYYWTQIVTMFGDFTTYEITSSYEEEIAAYEPGYCQNEYWGNQPEDYDVVCYDGYWYASGQYRTINVYGYVTRRVNLSTSTIYANNYASFNVSFNSNDGGYYVTLIQNLASYGEPSRHQYIYWRRTGNFYVKIEYSQPP